MLRIVRYRTSRFWALYDGQDLVVVTVYKAQTQHSCHQPHSTAPHHVWWSFRV